VWSTSDPVSRLALAITVILVAAKVGGDLAVRARQPSVLGELVAGILLGSLPLSFFRELRTDAGVDMLARLGVLVLLFEVGLDATVRDVMRVGVPSMRVAVLGTVGSLLFGWLAARFAAPGASPLGQMFLAAAITATSVGISARVLKDLGASRSPEAHTILGASVLDDVLGLVVLAIVSALVTHAGTAGTADTKSVTPWSVALLAGKTFGFLAIALVAGTRLSPSIFRLSARLRGGGALVAAGLSLCFTLAWAADVIGLSPIVGAFAAGLILEEAHSARFVARGEPSLRERMEPISAWLVPIFFVLIGMRADFRALTDGPTLLLVGALVVAACLGKLVCAWGAARGTDRLAVAVGMMPRGEVSLVFANLGLTLHAGAQPLLDSRQYSALVTVVVLTTLATPPALRWRLTRHKSGSVSARATPIP
jgi:Kef-type K+ transport system membrane component KefB